MKKNTKIIGGVVGFVLLIALIGSCGAEEEATEAPKQEEVTKVEKEVKEAPEAPEAVTEAPEVVAPEPKEEPKKQVAPEVDNSAKEEAMLALFKKNFGDEAVVFDKASKTYKVTPPIEVGLDVAKIYAGYAPRESWDVLVDNVVVVGENILEGIGKGYSIVIVNPSNTDNFLLSVYDGMVIYDVMNDSPNL